MNAKRLISAGVCLAVVAGCTACTGPSKKDIEAIENTLEEYGDALREADADALLETTDWEDDDVDYLKVAELMHFDTDNEYAVTYYKAVADTITIDYDSEDIEFKDGKATVKVTYELVDWEEALYNIRDYDGGHIRNAVEEAEGTLTFKGKITLVKDGKEWKITKTTNLEKVFSFIYLNSNPLPDIQPTEPEPIPTDIDVTPTPTSTPTPTPTTAPSQTVSYADVIKSATDVLYEDRELIEDAEGRFDLKGTNVYDLNQDGYPELIYLAADSYMDGEVFSADLYIWSYLPSAGKYMLFVWQKDITYMAGDGGTFILFTTDDEIVLTYNGGEESDYHTDTVVYDFDWKCKAHYRRDERFEYEPITQTELYSYDYHKYDNEAYTNDTEISENEYYNAVSGYIDDAKYVVARNYTPYTGVIEYGLVALPEFPMMSWYEASEYLESLAEN